MAMTPPTLTTGADAPRKFSSALLYQAGKGKFFTKQSLAKPAASAISPASAKSVSVSGEMPQKKNTIDSRTGFFFQDKQESSLSPDRLKTRWGGVESRDLRITAAAAKGLTRLFAALAINPGSGPEIPAEKRADVLDALIAQSHHLAEKLSLEVMGEMWRSGPKNTSSKIPVQLRAKLLQQAAEFVANEWIYRGTLDTATLEEVASFGFSGKVNSLTQDVADLFHAAETYTPATREEISQARITASSVRASWSLYRVVQKFDLRNYDAELAPTGGENQDFGPSSPFAWGRDVLVISRDLTKITLAIAKENQLAIDDLDMSTSWTQNAITRAAALVGGEYHRLTDSALRTTFSDPLYSEARLSKLTNSYEEALSRIHARARNNYLMIERNAVDAMSANAYTSYLSKKPVAVSEAPDTTSPIPAVPMSAQELEHVANEKSTLSKRFGFVSNRH